GEIEESPSKVEVNEPKVIYQKVVYGRRLKYEPNGDGTCKITGWDYRYDDPPSVIVIPEVLPNGLVVTEIAKYSFHFSDIEGVFIPDSVKFIDFHAFHHSEYYENEDNWEDGVLYIGKHLIEADLFAGGYITVKEGTLTLAVESFGKCLGLRVINLPASLQGIGSYAFEDCEELTEINFDGTKEMWYAIEKGEEWNKRTGEYTVHCTDGDIVKAES
ncbi:MAG: leucine-rich repeat protein, partial [Clostridia bacterium]|nr:leucine-rich repeat protein [Clostridia bacterium]